MKANRRMLKGVLCGFLGRYTSRDTDYKGYWLFGFLSSIPLLEVDLLGDNESRGTEPVELARCLAIDVFADQLAKVTMPESYVRRAGLVIRIVGRPVEEVAGDSLRRGNHLAFDVEVETDQKRLFRATRTVFVAAHDPALELRSRRADEEPTR